MRKIEQAMCNAIAKGKDWKSGNTEVIFSKPDPVRCWVKLHGNLIATIDYPNRVGQRIIKPNLPILNAWPTRTTCSRLRALGLDASIKNGVIHLF